LSVNGNPVIYVILIFKVFSVKDLHIFGPLYSELDVVIFGPSLAGLRFMGSIVRL